MALGLKDMSDMAANGILEALGLLIKKLVSLDPTS